MEGAATARPPRPRRILVATDFSPAAEAALERALDVAGALEGYVVLLHVVDMAPHLPESLVPRLRAAIDQARHAAGQVLTAAVEARRARGIPMSVVVAEGNPWRVIVEAAEQDAMDLVVLGADHRADRPHLLGGVTEKVVRAAPCPVLTVPACGPGEAQPAI